MSSLAGSGKSSSGQAIAWIEGRWGHPRELSLPLQDRGLLLADGLFETVLVLDGRPQLLEPHLQRWQGGAELLAMAPPPARPWLEPLIEAAIARAALAGPGWGALRLNWSRGSGGDRGIDLPVGAADPAQHRFWLQLTPFQPTFSPQTARLSRQERRNAASRLSRCKTFAYGQAIQARREARAAGADEALLLNGSGELCCGATANLLVQRGGRWLTPPLSSGCLPGVMRGRSLALGLATEATLEPAPQPGDRWLLLNSLGARPLSAVDGEPLQHLSAAEAEALWRQLL
jgi:4-amino-4-deoxychorismate lyase